MSNLFGDVVQQGYVVPDVEKAMQHWLARGVGPFVFVDIKDFPGVYDDKPIIAEMQAGFAYSGDQQIEVITPSLSHPSIYRDYLGQIPGGGLQHLAFWVDDIDEKLADLTRRDVSYRVWQRYGSPPDYKAHAYLDLIDQPGVMIQLMARSDFYDMLFGTLHAAAQDWDGSDPIRVLDPGSGGLIPRASQDA
jgi:catechol 2,3-dioxygenase-like lactoylglutathione lyase family enzyme